MYWLIIYWKILTQWQLCQVTTQSDLFIYLGFFFNWKGYNYAVYNV